jgi:antitoxin CcdA
MLQKLKAVQRRSTKLSLNPDLVAEAKALDLDISRVVEQSIALAVADEKSRRWKQENREAIQSMNDYVEQHGLPLEKYRQF